MAENVLKIMDWNPANAECKSSRGYIYKIKPLFDELAEILSTHPLHQCPDSCEVITKDVYMESLFLYTNGIRKIIKEKLDNILKTSTEERSQHSELIHEYESNKELNQILVLLNDLEIVRSDMIKNLTLIARVDKKIVI